MGEGGRRVGGNWHNVLVHLRWNIFGSETLRKALTAFFLLFGGTMIPMLALQVVTDIRDILAGRYNQFEKQCIINYNKYLLLNYNNDSGYANISKWRIHYLHYGAFISIAEEIFRALCYEFKLSNDKPTIIDCGSNIGLSILFFKIMYPQARIVGFEPDPLTYACLMDNMRLNDLRDVTLHNVALSDKDGVMPLNVCSDVPGSGSQNLFSRQHVHADSRVNVQTKKLSAYLAVPVDLLKVDIEGAELEVLKDLVSSGKIDLIRNMVMEFHFAVREHSQENLETILGMLTKSGFTYRIVSYGRSPFILSTDYAKPLLIYATR